jgi:hypothetical protein
MSTDITESPEESVELTEKDLDVIDEVNRENEPEETSADADETSGVSTEVDEPPITEDTSSDDSPDDGEVLREWANYYGLNPDDYADEGSLRRHVQSTAQYYQQVEQQRQQQAQWQQQQAQQAPLDMEGAASTAREFAVGLDEDYDEGLRSAINGLAGEMQTHYDGQLEILAQAFLDQQQYIGGLQQQEQSVQYRQELDSFDNAVGGLGNSGLFGESGYESLVQGSAESQNREHLYDQVLVLASGYQTHGKEIPSMDDLVGQAYRTVFSKEVDNQSRKSFNSRVRKQAKRRLGSGSSAKKTSVPTDDPVDNPVLKDAFDGFLKDNGDL